MSHIHLPLGAVADKDAEIRRENGLEINIGQFLNRMGHCHPSFLRHRRSVSCQSRSLLLYAGRALFDKNADMGLVQPLHDPLGCFLGGVGGDSVFPAGTILIHLAGSIVHQHQFPQHSNRGPFLSFVPADIFLLRIEFGI